MIQAGEGEGEGEHRRLSTAVQGDPLLGFVLFFCTERVLHRKGFVQALFVEEDFPGKVPFMISFASAAFSNFSLFFPPVSFLSASHGTCGQVLRRCSEGWIAVTAGVRPAIFG